jgi:2,3-bisphosphoglycerate-dependent phosphoglycerate mutase
MPKDENLSKHQVIEKMWEDENFKISEGLSHREHFDKIKPFLSNIFDNFKSNNKDLVIITHGVLIGIILKFFFKMSFGFNKWKTMSMPDIYFLNFDDNNKFLEMKRDNSNIERIFTI